MALAGVAVLLDVVAVDNGGIVHASGEALGALFLTRATTPREALQHLILDASELGLRLAGVGIGVLAAPS